MLIQEVKDDPVSQPDCDVLFDILQGFMCYSALVPLRKETPVSLCLETTTTESYQVIRISYSIKTFIVHVITYVSVSLLKNNFLTMNGIQLHVHTYQNLNQYFYHQQEVE